MSKTNHFSFRDVDGSSRLAVYFDGNLVGDLWVYAGGTHECVMRDGTEYKGSNMTTAQAKEHFKRVFKAHVPAIEVAA